MTKEKLILELQVLMHLHRGCRGHSDCTMAQELRILVRKAAGKACPGREAKK